MIPGGIWLAVRLIPMKVPAEVRATVAIRDVGTSVGKLE